MASCSKKMKLNEGEHVVDDQDNQVEKMDLKHKKIKFKTLTVEELNKLKVHPNPDIIIKSPEKEKEKVQGELGVELIDAEQIEAFANSSDENSDEHETSAILKESNDNKTEIKGRKRKLELIPYEPFTLAKLLKLSEEKVPIKEGPCSSGGKQSEDDKKKKE